MSNESGEQLTQEAYDRLKEELEHRSTTLRQEITDRIEVARAHGDLKENAEYHAAKDEQGHNEDRIRVVTERLRTATIVEVDTSSGKLGVGMVATIAMNGKEMDVFVGSIEDRPGEGVQVVSASSPMGKALLGAAAGDTVSYRGPGDRTFEVTVTDVRVG